MSNDPSQPRESDTDYDGFLSYSAEWHAFSHGIYMGFTTHPFQTPPEPKNRDVDRETHYYRGGYILGSLIQVFLVLVVLGGVGSGVAGGPQPPMHP